MPSKELQAFVQLVLSDESLQAHLRDIGDRDEFVAEVVRLGNDRGMAFTAGDVTEEMGSRRRAWLERF